MNFTKKKTEDGKIIRSMFSSLKRDNIDKFCEIINEHPNLLYFKNHRRENLLFYAFENNSKKIIDYIHACEPGFIKEKNIRNLNILHELILANKNIDYFLDSINYWSQNEINQLYQNNDPQGNNLILMAAKSGKIDVLEKIINRAPSFDTLQKHSNIYGQNVAHFIASNITTHSEELIKKLSPDLLNNLDNINGFTPLMLAAYHQEENNFITFFNLSPRDQESFLGNNLIHFAAHNSNISVLDFLISKGLYKNRKNFAEQSPLLIALTKGNEKASREIFNKAKHEIIYQEDIVNAVKISSKDFDLFKEIISNEKNEKLDDKHTRFFLENIFLQGMFRVVDEVLKIEHYKESFLSDSSSIVNLFSKTVTGKKEMSQKTNLLLKIHKESFLSKDETIGIITSLGKIPANQIKLLLKSTNLINKTLEENKVLFSALCLAKGLDHKSFGLNIEINPDEDIQRSIKRILRSVRIEDTAKHFHNVELWENLLEDKKVVWKHYGRIIAKNSDPFTFLKEKFEFLPKESRKKLVYYAVTALFKDEKEIPENVFSSIENYTNLLNNVFVGIIKVGKVPANQQLLNILPKRKSRFLDSNDFINVLKKSILKPKQTIDTLNLTIDLFSFDKVQNMDDLCRTLVNNPFHYDVMEKIAIVLPPNDKDRLMYSYIDNYITSPNATINMEVLEQLILSSENTLNVISHVIYKALSTNDFDNIDFIKQIKSLTDDNLLPDTDYAQNLINNEDFNACLKLQKISNKDFNIKKINLNNIDWESIDKQVITMDKNIKFFDFIAYNKNSISEKQINILTLNLLKKAKEKSISFKTIENYLTALNSGIRNIEDDILHELSVNVLNKQSLKDIMSKSLSQKSFDAIFDLISNNKNGIFFEKIRYDNNFNLIAKESRIIMDKEILEATLENKIVIAPKIKKLKL